MVLTKVEQVKKIVKSHKVDLNSIAKAVLLIEGVKVNPAESGVDISVYSNDYKRFLGLVQVRQSSNPYETYWYVVEQRKV